MMVALGSKHTVIYELGEDAVVNFDLGGISGITMTFPSAGTVYIADDGTIQFVPDKEDAINEIKGQPFF